MTNDKKYIIDLFQFLSKAEKLKNTLRTSHTSTGRHESTAEHSWMLSLLGLLITEKYPHTDHIKILSLCIVHDIAESITGDIPATKNNDPSKKEGDEFIAMVELVDCLPDRLACHILSLWDEYNRALTTEAKLVKALDKIETIFQHTIGINPEEFDYLYNLEYGDNLTSFDKLINDIRKYLNMKTQEIIDSKTRKALLNKSNFC